MNCNFIWWALPKTIKEKLSINLKYNWNRIPIELNLLLDELKVNKPNCYSELYPNGHNIHWFNLPVSISKVCSLIECEENEINFDITADWTELAGVSDEASFIDFLETNGLTDVTISDFSLVDGRLKCNLSATGSSFDFSFINIYEFNKIGGINGLASLGIYGGMFEVFNPVTPLPESLEFLMLAGSAVPLSFNPILPLPSSLKELVILQCQLNNFNPTTPLPESLRFLRLHGNQIVDFNPTLPLPSGLEELEISGNQIVDFNPNIALPSSLTYLDLSDNQIVEFNPTLPLPSSLRLLHLSFNQIVSFDPNIALPTTIQELNLYENQIINFNPTLPLPSSLRDLGLINNQMTIAGYTASEPWATLQPAFSNTCDIYFSSNIDSVTGTNLETILLTKNVNIIP